MLSGGCFFAVSQRIQADLSIVHQAATYVMRYWEKGARIILLRRTSSTRKVLSAWGGLDCAATWHCRMIWDRSKILQLIGNILKSTHISVLINQFSFKNWLIKDGGYWSHKNVFPEPWLLDSPYGISIFRSSKVSSAQIIFLPFSLYLRVCFIFTINVLLSTAVLCVHLFFITSIINLHCTVHPFVVSIF